MIDGFNAACKNISASFMKVGDESMSAIFFMTTAKGNLLHLSYIFRKPEKLGKEFNKVACSVTGALLLIEVQIWKEGMKHSNYKKELGATVTCTKKILEATKVIGQKSIKGGTKDCFLFDSWLASKKAAEAAMNVGDEFIAMLKTNTKGFCKETIEKLTKDWPGGSYLVLSSKPMIPRDRLLIAICYTYHEQKVLYFIVIYNAGSTKNGIPYSSKYPDQFTNISICPFARPLFM